MKDLVSVIIPVYNAHTYLRECIESILGQTYKNLEVICIDDGSTDSSADICDEYAKIDNRVRVVRKENGGVSSARNLGLDIARGEYVTFIDSDDYVANEYIEKLYECINTDADTDISLCNFSHVIDGRITPHREQLPSSVDLLCSDGSDIEFITRFFKFKDNIFGSACRVLWRKKCIIDTRFNTSISISEDMLFVLMSLKHAKRLRSVQYEGYFYRINSASVTKSYKKSFLNSQINLHGELKAFANSLNDERISRVIEIHGALLAYYVFSNELKFRPAEWRKNIKLIRKSELYKHFKLSKGLLIDSLKIKGKFLIVWILVKSRLV